MTSPLLLGPRRYLRSGYGLALPTDYTFSQLRTALARAQNQVSRFCNVPKLPQAFDWRGGAMADEQHQWRVQNPLAYNSGVKRVYLNAGPLKTITALAIDLGKTYRVEFNPATDLYVNHIENYCEVVAIAPVIAGVWPLALPLGLYEPISRTSYTYGWSYEIIDDVLEAESPTLYSMAYGNLDSAIPPVVSVGGTEVDPSDYTVDYGDGTILFATAPSPGQEVLASYTYLCPSEIVDAIGIVATNILAGARLAQRGLIGLSSLKVAEVSMAVMTQAQTTRNGATLPNEAAQLVDGFVFGSVA